MTFVYGKRRIVMNKGGVNDMSSKKDTILKVYELIREYCQSYLSSNENLVENHCIDGSHNFYSHQTTIISYTLVCSVKFDGDRRIFTITVPPVLPGCKNISFEININTEEIIASKDDYQKDSNLQRIIGFLHEVLGYYVFTYREDKTATAIDAEWKNICECIHTFLQRNIDSNIELSYAPGRCRFCMCITHTAIVQIYSTQLVGSRQYIVQFRLTDENVLHELKIDTGAELIYYDADDAYSFDKNGSFIRHIANWLNYPRRATQTYDYRAINRSGLPDSDSFEKFKKAFNDAATLKPNDPDADRMYIGHMVNISNNKVSLKEYLKHIGGNDMPTVKNVLFNEKKKTTTIVWTDGTKTICRTTENDAFDPEIGFAMCYMKKIYKSRENFKRTVNKYVDKCNKKAEAKAKAEAKKKNK